MEGVLEFGSVVKPLVMAGALNMGVVTPEMTYNDKGSVIVEDYEIFNFDKKGRGPGTSMQEVLNQSLNTGMVFVEKKWGKRICVIICSLMESRIKRGLIYRTKRADSFLIF